MASRLGAAVGEPEHVASGTFRVDRARLLEKLAAYSLSEPSDFLLPWIRAAAMGGAKKVWIWTRANGVELRFDGKPFSAPSLTDLYSGLLDDSLEDGPRRRELAIGMLTVLVRGPRSKKGKGPRLELRSGDASGAAVLITDSVAAESVEVSFDPTRPGTTILVELPERPKTLWSAPAERVSAACGGPRGFSIFVENKEIGSGGPEGGHEIELDGVRASLTIAPPDTALSNLDLFSWGVAAGRLETRLPGLPVFGEVEDPRLQLDAARANAVRDENLERTLGVVSRMGVRVAAGVFDKARAFIASRSWYWSTGQDHTARSLAVLRLQCARQIANAPDGLRELREALFFVDGRGMPVPVGELDRRIRRDRVLRLGNHPVRSQDPSKGRKPEKDDKPYVWLTQAQDREALTLLFCGVPFVDA
ncbi:MAG: hypothetical protein HY925_14995 [Elusimicrobia bacterium]|nr:hypothetical protein [Elusimicrobiota bacterium]